MGLKVGNVGVAAKASADYIAQINTIDLVNGTPEEAFPDEYVLSASAKGTLARSDAPVFEASADLKYNTRPAGVRHSTARQEPWRCPARPRRAGAPATPRRSRHGRIRAVHGEGRSQLLVHRRPDGNGGNQRRRRALQHERPGEGELAIGRAGHRNCRRNRRAAQRGQDRHLQPVRRHHGGDRGPGAQRAVQGCTAADRLGTPVEVRARN